MSRRLVEILSAVVALSVLAIVLYNATLVDRLPPSIDRIYLSAPAPGNDRIGQAQTAIDVQFSEGVRTASVESRFKIEPHVEGTFSWEGSRTLIFTPSDKLPPSSSYQISIAGGFTDLAGNANDSGLAPWSFQTVGPPTVVDTTPDAGATDVTVGTEIKLTFDRLMDTAATVQAISIDPPAGYRATWGGPVVTLTLDTPLGFAKTYTVTVGVGASGTDGTHLAAPFTTSFTTVAAGLVALATVPAPNSAGISVRSPIAILYDGPLDPASIADSLSITPPVSGDLRAVDLADDTHPVQNASPVASAGGSGHVLLFAPSQPLAPHTTYTVTLHSVVHLLGDPGQVAAGSTWSFTTGQPTASAQNQIAFLSARGGIRNVWLMNPDGTNPREVTTELVPVTNFDVSPDGTELAYASGGVVRLMKMDGSQTQLLTHPGTEEYSPVIAPDGASVVVARRDGAGADLGYWRIPIAGGSGDERQILPDGAPALGSTESVGDGLVLGSGRSQWARGAAFSSDGHALAVVGGDGGVRVVDLAAPDKPPARPNLIASEPPVWSRADGAFYLVASAGSGAPALWRISPTGAASRVSDAAGGLAVSADGHVALVIEIGDQVHLAYASGGHLEQLVSDARLADRTPSFAPDGQSILFTRVLESNPFRSQGIWLIGVDGTGLRQLSTDGVAARWLP